MSAGTIYEVIACSVRKRAGRGYYYRGDHMKLDDNDWHCFTLAQYDRHTGEWELQTAPVYHIVD